MKSSIGVLGRIQARLETFKAAERRVADFVLDDPAAAIALSIADLATAAGTSEPTVMRFVRKVDCSGYPEFKQRLSQDLAVAQMFVFPEDDVPPREPEDVVERVYRSTGQALAQTLAQRDSAALRAAADAILAANRVFCFGIGGSSANLAAEAVTRLFRYDVKANFTSDHYQQRLMAGLCERNDVLLIFSVTGQPPALVETAEVARELGAEVISVTRPGSALAAASSILLPLDIPDHETHFQIPHRTRYGQMFILDCLATLVATDRLGKSAAKLHRLRGLLLRENGPTNEQPVGD